MILIWSGAQRKIGAAQKARWQLGRPSSTGRVDPDKSHESSPMCESLSHGFGTNWQMTKTCTRGGKDRVPDRRCDHGRCCLTKAGRCFCTCQKLDLDFRYVAHAEQRISVEIRILRLAFHEF